MTRDEMSKLLEFIYGAYPKTPMRDPKGTLDAWMLALGSNTAESVYKAARLHVETSPYGFPSPADIKSKIVRASMVYNEDNHHALLTPIKKEEQTKDKEKLDGWLDAFCEWIGFGCEPNDDALSEYYEKNPDMRAKMSGILKGDE